MTTDPRTFDLFDSAESIEYPEDFVIVHRNRKALYEIHNLVEKINKTIDPAVVETLEAEVAQLRKVLSKTDLRVSLKGIPTTTIDDIQNSVSEPAMDTPAESASAEERALWQKNHEKAVEDRYAAINMKILQTMIVEIVEVESGRVANHPQERTQEWYETLPMEERSRILTKLRELSFNALELETEADSPGF